MRPTRDVWAMRVALLTAERATCLRRRVGCVLLNARGHVLATGYNGVAAGLPHCNEPDWATVKSLTPLVGSRAGSGTVYPHACAGARAPSGSDLNKCEAVHAEQNAMLQAKDVYAIDTCYVTASPCETCTKLLLNTSCQRVVFAELYPHPAAKELWERAGRTWEQLRF